MPTQLPEDTYERDLYHRTMCACYNVIGSKNGGFVLRNYDVAHIDYSYDLTLTDVCESYRKRCEKLLGMSDEAFETEFKGGNRWGESYTSGCVKQGIVNN